MKILGVHAYYRNRGGEDAAFDGEMALLRARGESVQTFTCDNALLSDGTLAFESFWNGRGAEQLAAFVRTMQPDIIHLHNTFPGLLPSIVPLTRWGPPIVATLHNYRLVCANGLLLRGGQPCELCVSGGNQLAAIYHRCYRGSAVATAAVVLAQTMHDSTGFWTRKVARVIALTEFAKAKFIAGGFSDEQVVVKPNCVDIPATQKREEPFVLYAGRLSLEKGIDVLLEAFSQVRALVGLTIVGSGPLEAKVRAAAAADPRIAYLGSVSRPSVISLVHRAMVLLCPSICYEGFPLVVAEAFGCATPVVASRSGSLSELVEDGRTGVLFTTGSARELAQAIERLAADATCRRRLGEEGRRRYELSYTPDCTYRQLLEVYTNACSQRS